MVQDVGSMVQGLGFSVYGSGLRVRSMVQGLWFRVY